MPGVFTLRPAQPFRPAREAISSSRKDIMSNMKK